jgi:hypothetical protein
MAKNEEMFKSAIAEAKALKTMAIANAKAALEEAFTPQLTTMFSAKIREMEEEKEDELYEDDDINLDEVLNEVEEEIEDETEDETSEDEEEEKEDDSLNIEDMTKEDLEKLIEDIMLEEFPELSQFKAEDSEDEDSDEEINLEDEVEDEEISLDEILNEMEDDEDDEVNIEEMLNELEEESVEEGLFTGLSKNLKAFRVATDVILMFKKGESEDKIKLHIKSSYPELDDNGVEQTFTDIKKSAQEKGLVGESDEMESLRMERDELMNEVKEVNMLNAKLLYTNKIFKSKNLNESQKVKVLGAFDKTTSVKEVKLVYETLLESLKVKTPTHNQVAGRASKPSITPSKPTQIIESNDQYLRMQKLAGII